MRILILLALGIILAGCGDNSKLSRSTAEDLIEGFEKFRTVTEKIPYDSPRFPWNGSAPMGRALEQVLSAMAQEGLVTYSKQPGWITSFRIELTDSGKKHFIREVKEDMGDSRWTEVKLCDREIEEVTGIEQPQPMRALVHFMYKTGSPTPFGKLAPKVCSDEKREGRARLALFDDGWRVEKVETSEPRW